MAVEFTKNLILHTVITKTDAHHFICYHIDNGEDPQIMNVIKALTRDQDVKEAYSQLEKIKKGPSSKLKTKYYESLLLSGERLGAYPLHSEPIFRF